MVCCNLDQTMNNELVIHKYVWMMYLVMKKHFEMNSDTEDQCQCEGKK